METNNAKKGMQYVSPRVNAVKIELEQGIAAGSGAATPSTSPEVTDFGTGTEGTSSGDM
jgi:hypothetical protein